jgi:molecular chaperone GrpE
VVEKIEGEWLSDDLEEMEENEFDLSETGADESQTSTGLPARKKAIRKKSLPKKKIKDEIDLLNERIENLTGELEKREIELRETTERSLRAVADAENYKKRMAREGAETTANAARDTVEKLLPSLDNLLKAVESAKEENVDLESFRDGVSMVYDQMMSTLSSIGLEKIDMLGKVSDPESCEVIQMVESDEYEEGVVVAQIAPGYKFNGRVIRYAKVIVSKGTE